MSKTFSAFMVMNAVSGIAIKRNKVSVSIETTDVILGDVNKNATLLNLYDEMRLNA